MNEILFSRLSLGVNRATLAAAAGIPEDRLCEAEEDVEALSEANEAARVAALQRLIDERLARAAEGGEEAR